MKIILSIKPKYVKAIFSGNKIFEYRKTIFKQSVDTVIIYASSPVSKIVGEFAITDVLSETPERLWELTALHSGIEKSFYDNYFVDKDIAYAIKIGGVKKYDKPLKLAKLVPNAKPPQSFMYLR